MTTTQKSYESATVKVLDGSEVEIKGSIAFETLNSFRTKAIKNINDSISLDGFRKGMVPENILITKVGDMAILEEMAELAISQAYMDIIIDNKIDAIGKPAIQVTKLADKNPLEFIIKTAVLPEISLPDYKEISTKENSKKTTNEEKVTDKEIEDTIMKIRKSHVSHEGHDHAKLSAEEHEKMVMDNLPELNDAFVKTLGDFNDVPDFKNKLSLMIAEQKMNEARDKRRVNIADAIADATKITIPNILIESELARIEAQFGSDVERMGVKLEDYLKHAKKTLDDVRKEWRPHAEKKAKLQLIINAIAQKENIKPETNEIEEEVDRIVEHYKDADREKAATYAETVLTNEKVFEWLERQ